jgi:hypothetical protein
VNDLEKNESYTPAKKLEKYGVNAVIGIAGGVILLTATVLGARFPVVGLVLGAVSAFFGAGALFSKDPDDKKPGAILAAAGACLILSRVGLPLIRPLASSLLSIGALGFLATGILNGIRFLKGLNKNRS